MEYQKTFKFLAPLVATFMTPLAHAQGDNKVQDMSDPLAVYTQAGIGLTDKGLNIKVGQTYDTGNADTAGMNIIEVKGMLGEYFGWRGDNRTDNSIDSVRIRNFNTNLTNGIATQTDMNIGLQESLVAESNIDLSYSFIKALPPVSVFTFYPLAGIGVSMGENAVEDDGSIDSGYSIMGTYALIGMYAKVTITDKIWLNYNPFWLTTLSGAERYKNNYYGENENTLLTHEFAASYQINPRLNVRYFANWNENVDFADGDQRIELNYQI